MRQGTRLAALAAALALILLGACAPEPAPGPEGPLVYFVDTGHETGGALRGEVLPGGERSVDALVSALLAGPAGENLRSPIPADTALRGWKLEDGLLTLDLSEGYGGLSGVELTLANYCITLTLCQLEGVESVQITAAGRPLSYREHQVLKPEEAVLEGGG